MEANSTARENVLATESVDGQNTLTMRVILATDGGFAGTTITK